MYSYEIFFGLVYSSTENSKENMLAWFGRVIIVASEMCLSSMLSLPLRGSYFMSSFITLRLDR